jgi:arginyl-tRNA synthetase
MQACLERACEDDDPSVLAHACIELASLVSSWLSAGSKDQSARVLCDDASTAASRIHLVRLARVCLGEGLRLLGLCAPERM